MKTNLLCLAHVARLRASFRYGLYVSGRHHVNTSPREIVRIGWGMLRTHPRTQRDDRRALYAGIFAGLRNERRMMSSFNL